LAVPGSMPTTIILTGGILCGGADASLRT
jgi:hypothetical protein